MIVLHKMNQSSQAFHSGTVLKPRLPAGLSTCSLHGDRGRVVTFVTITARLFHGIIILIVLSMSVRSVRKTFVIVNVDPCYSPQESGQN
jgi:hypothetical protein